LAIAKAHSLPLIEDCAQATGAEWTLPTGDRQKVGSIGDIGCFSFYPSKNLGGCGDGGAITTHRADLAEAMRMIRDHGRRSGYLHEVVGMNSRLDSIQAAILDVKLRHLDAWNRQRQTVAQQYHELLEHLPDLVLPTAHPNADAVWNQYTVRVRDSAQTVGSDLYRDRIRQELQQQGIQTMVYYPIPLHLQPVYTHLKYQPGQLPLAEQAAAEVLALPMFPELTFEEQAQIRDSLKEVLTGN
ncbi:MAG TPA: DegT/DnrJ/EryC1/StrS family aminotransferase, partial [Stenomitos sp.]